MIQLLKRIKKRLALLLSGGGPDYSSRLQAESARHQSLPSLRKQDQPLEYFRALKIEDVHHYFNTHLAMSAPGITGDTVIRAKCYVCQRDSEFEVRMAEGSVNWRETLRCRGCRLINRWRSCFHLFEAICCPTVKTRVFITEAITPLHDLIRERYPETVGSEFSPTAARGAVISVGGRQVLMQDVTRLTFPADHFDCILSFDVLEHVPDYKSALHEFARVLRKGGNLLLSVPFTFELKTEVRATVEEDGSVRNILPPEYHGDPMSRAGVLCYQAFGMDLLKDLEDSGFHGCYLCCYASAEWAYLGANVLFVAQKL